MKKRSRNKLFIRILSIQHSLEKDENEAGETAQQLGALAAHSKVKMYNLYETFLSSQESFHGKKWYSYKCLYPIIRFSHYMKYLV